MSTPIVTLGFDPSLNALGWAVMRDKQLIECGTVKHSSKAMRPEKHVAIVGKVMMLLNRWKPNAIGIEEERVFNSTGAVTVGEVIGIVKGCCILWGIGERDTENPPQLIYDVHPASSRSVFGIGGKERNKKPYILLQARKTFPHSEIQDHNAADAVITAYFTYHRHLKLV